MAEIEKMCDKLYSFLGPRLGVYLVEANVVLTLYGARGYTEFHVKNFQAGDEQKLLSANREVCGLEIRLKPIKELVMCFGMERPTRCLRIAVENLAGYEFISKKIEKIDIKPFDADSGWHGKKSWLLKLHMAISRARQSERINSSYRCSDIQMGIILGYPMAAILDFEKWNLANAERYSGGQTNSYLSKWKSRVPVQKRKKTYDLACSDIPEAQLYGGDLPDFFFSKANVYHPDIVKTIDSWRKILKDFYDSKWHQKICQDPNFIRERDLIKCVENAE